MSSEEVQHYVSKADLCLIGWPQLVLILTSFLPRENQNFLESKVDEDTTTLNDSNHTVGSKIVQAHFHWPQERHNLNSMESKVKGTTTLNDLHHTMGSKIGLAHLHWSQERQNQNLLKSKVGEDTTTFNDLHHSVGSKIGPAICLGLRSTKIKIPWNPK